MTANPTVPRALPKFRDVQLPASAPPRLFVVVDTEEEFDWNAPYSRSNTSVTAMKYIDRAQRIFDTFSIKPTYVIDFPVACQPGGYEPLLSIAARGRCTIGAHLHPWVNPPYDEEMSVRNSFTMNLPAPLQKAKLDALTEVIADRFGQRPRVFKAGRYGLGSETIPLLEAAGFQVDASICPRFDFENIEGPSFTDFDSTPFFLTPQLLELPCTVDYVGWAGALGPALHRLASTTALERVRARGVLARSRAVNQVMVSPEGNSFEEMRSLTSDLVSRGLRTFTLSFHSPSLAPGHTPYVHNQSDLDRFLREIEMFCSFFVNELDGVPATPLEFLADITRADS